MSGGGRKQPEITSEFRQGNAHLEFYDTFLSQKRVDKLRAHLEGLPVATSHVMIMGKVAMPRQMLWVSDLPRAVYRFSKSHIDPLEPEPFTPELERIRARVQKLTGKTFNSLLVNLYRGGSDSVSWHADDDPWLGANFTVPSLSIGAERVFKLRPTPVKVAKVAKASSSSGAGASAGVGAKKAKNVSVSFTLKSGSLMLMKGMTQNGWQHSVPKTAKKIGRRFNLTFRNVVPSLISRQFKDRRQDADGQPLKPKTKAKKTKAKTVVKASTKTRTKSTERAKRT